MELSPSLRAYLSTEVLPCIRETLTDLRARLKG
jgi:hypothetical protein